MGAKKAQNVGAKGKPGRGQPPGTSHPRNLFEKVSTPPLSFLLIAAAIFVVYAQTLPFDFTRFDDDLIVINNLEWYQDFGNIGAAFAKDAFNNDAGYAFYRPMQNISFFADAQIWGSHPAGFRATNLLLHWLTCISICLLFRFLKLDARLSFLAVLIYSVHPLFAHAVIWIPSRGDLLIGLFGTLSYIAFLKYIESNRSIFLLLHAAVFFAALFSKETAILLPLPLMAHVFLFGERFRFQRRYLWLAASWALVTGAYLVCRAQVILVAPKKDEFGLLPLIGNLQAIPEFFSKFMLPWNLAVMPVFSPMTTLLGVLFLLLLGWHIRGTFKAGKGIYILGLTWFVLFTAVTMLYRHKLGKAGYDYLEHRAYLPTIGILMVLVRSVHGIIEKWDWRKVFGSGVVVVIALCAMTMVHGREYRNPMTFYAAAIESNPKCAMAYYNRAKYKQLLGDKTGAMADYDDAIRVKPDCADAYNNRGNARKSFGDLQGALQDYDEAIRWDQNFPLAFFNRGNARLARDDKQGASEDYSRAIALEPTYVKAFNNRGTIYYGFGKLELAYADFDRALQINPGFADAWRNRGSVKFRAKDVSGACADWLKGGQAGNNEAAGLYQRYCR